MMYAKQRIPKALREQVWLKYMGRAFDANCTTAWCRNRITVFDFHVGHRVPESKGGATTIDNLVPLCSRCNLSMGNQYTTDEWSDQFQARTWKQFCSSCCSCFFAPSSRTNGKAHAKGKQGKGR